MNASRLAPLMQHTHDLTQALVNVFEPKKDIDIRTTASSDGHSSDGIHLCLLLPMNNEALCTKIAQCLLLDIQVQRLMYHAAIHIGSSEKVGVVLGTAERKPTLWMERDYTGNIGPTEPLSLAADEISGENEFEREDNLVAHYRHFEREAKRSMKQAAAGGFRVPAPFPAETLEF
jgi:hypothetical protein